MRASFIKAHRKALVDFFEDQIRARRWFLDPKNHAAALALAARVTKLPQSRLQYAFTKQDFYRSPDMRPDIALIQKEINESVKLKVLPKPVTISPTYVDLSLIADAKRRIGK
ncbi:MAG TPA: hypothetical protein VGR91_12850, partial [Stellaceae bacterium]|nr:hypothetical protein [Stellaceae bacterium]